MLREKIEDILRSVAKSDKVHSFGAWYWDGQSTLKVHYRYMDMPPTIGRIKYLLNTAEVEYKMLNDYTFLIVSLGDNHA